MTIESRTGDILRARDLEAIVNPVNCVGVMGRGLAKQFAERHPDIVEPYRRACREGRLTTAQCLPVELNGSGLPRYAVNVATKRHWRDPSRIEWIGSGLTSLYEELARLGIKSVGIPPLGAGLGGLKTECVAATIRAAAELSPEVRTVMYRRPERRR